MQQAYTYHTQRNFNTHTQQNNRFESNLLPNEMRISSQGNFNTYIRTALTTMEQGYQHCKIVGRGTASKVAWDILQYLKRKAPQYTYTQLSTKALNKQGMVVDELHIMIGRNQVLQRDNHFQERPSTNYFPRKSFQPQPIGQTFSSGQNFRQGTGFSSNYGQNYQRGIQMSKPLQERGNFQQRPRRSLSPPQFPRTQGQTLLQPVQRTQRFFRDDTDLRRPQPNNQFETQRRQVGTREFQKPINNQYQQNRFQQNRQFRPRTEFKNSFQGEISNQFPQRRFGFQGNSRGNMYGGNKPYFKVQPAKPQTQSTSTNETNSHQAIMDKENRPENIQEDNDFQQ